MGKMQSSYNESITKRQTDNGVRVISDAVVFVFRNVRGEGLMKKKILAIALILVMIVSMTACGSKEKKTEGASETDNQSKKLVLGINDWPGSYWWLAVNDLGYFKEQGVDVEVKLFSNYTDGLNALISGNVDLFVPALADVLPGYSNGANIKVIMVQDYSAGADGLIASSDIQSVEELKGKNIGIEFGGTDHVFLLKCLENAGLTENDVNLVNMSTGDAANAFMSGSLDAAAIWEPSLSQAQKETGGNILATTKDKEYEGLLPAVLVANGDSLEKYRDEMKLVMKAWFNARDAYENNFDAFAEAVAKHAEVTPEEFKTLMEGCDVRTMDQNVDAFKDGDTYVSLNYTAKMLGAFQKEKGLIDTEPTDYSSLFDDTIFNEVYKELNQ